MREAWPYRGLQHAVAGFVMTELLDLRADLTRPVRLDDPLFRYTTAPLLTSGRVRDHLRLACREWFRIRCTIQDANSWAVLEDAVLWISSRLRAIPGLPLTLPWEDRTPEETDAIVRMAGEIMFAPGQMVPILSISKGTPCWCGSEAPYLECCGVNWEPKAEHSLRQRPPFRSCSQGLH